MRSDTHSYRLIKDAYKALNKKRFQEAIAILEKALSSGMGDVYVLLLLSVAYLYTDQFGKLARFISKMKEKNAAYLPLLQLEAYLKLKSAAGYDEALRVYADLAARYPADPHFHRGRNLLGQVTDFPAFQKEALLYDFVLIPPPPRTLKRTRRNRVGVIGAGAGHSDSAKKSSARFSLTLKLFIVAFVAAIAIGLGWDIVNSVFIKKAFERIKRPGRDFSSIDMISISGTEYDLVKKTPKDRLPVFYQSAVEVTRDFNRARELIKSEKFNEALILLNSLYSSNINFIVKEKVEFLIKFIINTDDRNFSDVPYATVSDKKFLYRGYAVRWQGEVGRVRVKNGRQTYALSVGAESKNGPGDAEVYSGTVMPELKKGSVIILEGVIVDFLGKNKTIYIEARNVRKVR